jgi:hypothetical protein
VHGCALRSVRKRLNLAVRFIAPPPPAAAARSVTSASVPRDRVVGSALGFGSGTRRKLLPVAYRERVEYRYCAPRSSGKVGMSGSGCGGGLTWKYACFSASFAAGRCDGL